MATLDADRIWIPPLRGRCVAYLRQSERPHGRLDPEAQLKTIKAMLIPGKTKLLEEYTEREPLTDNERPELRRAVQHCANARATLLIGQIDRMRSAVRWLGIVKEKGVKFRGADAPHINELSYHQLVVADLHWREEMGETVAASLARARAEGASLGGDRGYPEGLKLGPGASATARRFEADRRDTVTMNVIRDVRYRGITTLAGIAKRLNQRGLPAPRGGLWSPAQVRRVIRKFEDE